MCCSYKQKKNKDQYRGTGRHEKAAISGFFMSALTLSQRLMVCSGFHRTQNHEFLIGGDRRAVTKQTT